MRNQKQTKRVQVQAYNEKIVEVIDWSKINNDISEECGMELQARLGKGFVADRTGVYDKDLGVAETKCLVLDSECCGGQTTTRNMVVTEDGGITTKVLTVETIKVPFYKVGKPTIDEDGTTHTPIFVMPLYHFHIDIDVIKKNLTGEKITLFELMKNRYDYNGRIKSNEVNTMQVIMGTDYLPEDYIKVEVEG